jgi:CheY-like chemotaxis protein
MNATNGLVRPLKMVLIEDSLMDINLFKIALSRRNSTTELTTFRNGEMAISYFRKDMGQESKPDLTILDLNLPGMGGIEVLEKLKGDPIFRSIPVVVFSSTQLNDEIKRCYDKGAVKVVTKPAELGPFLESVQGIEDCARRKLEGDVDRGKGIGGESNNP